MPKYKYGIYSDELDTDQYGYVLGMGCSTMVIEPHYAKPNTVLVITEDPFKKPFYGKVLGTKAKLSAVGEEVANELWEDFGVFAFYMQRMKTNVVSNETIEGIIENSEADHDLEFKAKNWREYIQLNARNFEEEEIVQAWIDAMIAFENILPNAIVSIDLHQGQFIGDEDGIYCIDPVIEVG